MDPNKTLANLIDWAAENADTDETAQLLLDLDEWLTKGGFLPDRWKSPIDSKVYNWAKDHEINHTLTQASLRDARTQMRRITSGLCDVADILDDIEKELGTSK